MATIAVPTLRPLMLPPTVAPACEPVVITPNTNVASPDPADFAALRHVLETVGHFAPAPPDPPWADPRPDLATDTCTCAEAQRRCKCHERWLALLEAAYRHDGQDPHGVYGTLNGIHCCGARLEVAAAPDKAPQAAGVPPGWRLKRGDELTEAEYQRLRAIYLGPHTEVLTRLLNAPPAGGVRQPG
jgi:hypothetical protein